MIQRKTGTSEGKFSARTTDKFVGTIINIGSVIGIHGNAGQSVYSASKAGLIGFTKSLAKELGSRGITVNLVAPGFIDVGMTQSTIRLHPNH